MFSIRERCRAAGVALLVTALTATACRSEEGSTAWNLENVLKVLKAREESIASLEVRLDVVEGLPALAEYKRYLERRYASRAAILAALKIAPPPLEPFEKQGFSPAIRAQVQYAQSGVLQKYERFVEGADKSVVRTEFHIYDGAKWNHYTAGQGKMDDGKVETPGVDEYLGLDLRPSRTRFVGTRGRYLHGLLESARRAGFLVEVSREPENNNLVVVVLRSVTAPPKSITEVVRQLTFWFDPKLGMALVKFERRDVYMEGGSYKQTYPPDWDEAHWDTFVDEGNGLWLPRHYKSTTNVSLVFPREGDAYPIGFDPEKPSLEGYRHESFMVQRSGVNVLDASVNKPLDAKDFAADYPLGTIVYNAFDRKPYQVGGVSGKTEMEVLRVLEVQPQTSGPGRAGVVVLLGVVAALLCAVGWVLLRRQQARKVSA
jgi:hypothetical protein